MIPLACLAIGWLLTSITLAEWTALLAGALLVATMLFVFRKGT